MSGIQEQFEHLLQETKGFLNHAIGQFPKSHDDLQLYVSYVQSLTADDIVHDITQLKLTPVTVTLAITAVSTLFFLGRALGPKSAATKKPKKEKKLSKAQRANRDIQKILDFVEGTYVPQIDDYIENYHTLKGDDGEYKYNYFSEMLLKEILKLDGVDVDDNEILKTNRKKVIKFIQDHQKRLDKFKKETK